MVQPRKEQVKNLKTRHSKVQYSPSPGESYTDILDGDIYSQVISDTPGGVQESTPAAVISTGSEPYAPLDNDTFTIKIDDPNPFSVPFTVILAATDTTASRIADKINAAYGANVALNDAGVLKIFSGLTGEDAYITLAEVSAGALGRIGLVAGTTNGVEAPSRGIITKEYNLETEGGTTQVIQGGFVPIRSGDGRAIVTDATSSSVIWRSGISLVNISRRIDTPGGMPVHGRIERDPANTGYRVSYYSIMPTEATVRTFNSSFGDLDNTDSFTITSEIQYVDGGTTVSFPVVVTVTFLSVSYDRDSVISRINEVLANTVSSSAGKAFVVGTISSPFTLDASKDGFVIEVDGGAPQAITFLGTEKTTQNVVDRINAVITGATASVVSTTGDNKVLAISSDENDGTISSIELRNAGTYPTLEKFGIVQGLYRGVFMAEAYGDEEIAIKAFRRGGGSYITIGGNVATLTKMGLTANTYYGKDGGEVKVNFPYLDTITDNNTFSLLLVPEIVEYGETDWKVESTIQEFDTHYGVSPGGKGALTTYGDKFTGLSWGLKHSGKPVFVNARGFIDNKYIQNEATNVLKKFVIGDFTPGINSVEKLATGIIQTPGVDGNPGTPLRVLGIEIDPDETAVTPLSPWSLYVRFWRDTVNAIVPFQFSYTSDLTNVNWVIKLDDTAGVYCNSGPLLLADDNTVVSGTANSGLKEVPLTDGITGRYPRVFEVEGNAVGQPSIIGKINAASWTVTVGDGIVSFGDFSDSSAIHQAIDFFNTNVATLGITGMRILCKAGTFIVDGTVGPITIPDGVECIIQGIAGAGEAQPVTTISSDQATTIQFAAPTNPSVLVLRDIEVSSPGSTTFTNIVVNQGRIIKAYNSSFQFASIRLEDAKSCEFKECYFLMNSTVADRANIRLELSDGTANHTQFRFTDCYFASGQNNPVLRIGAASSSIPATEIKRIEFIRCKMDLLSTTDDGFGNLTGNCGVIDSYPNGSVYDFLTNGIRVNKILWKDCVVNANVAAGTNSILIHLIPQTNGNNVTSTSDELIYYYDVEIDGGEWIAPKISTTYTPFVISGCLNITVKNATLGFEQDLTGAGYNYGSATADLAYWLTLDPVGTVPTQADWGAFCFDGGLGSLLLHNLKFVNLIQRSGAGDLFIRFNQLIMTDIYMLNYQQIGPGAASGPTQRIRFRPQKESVAAGVHGVVDNLIMGRFEGGLGAGNSWAVQGFIVYEPSNAGFTFRNVKIGPFPSDGATSGIFVPQVAAGDLYAGSPHKLDNLIIDGCKFERLSGSGFFYAFGDIANGALGHLCIVNTTIRDCDNWGVLVQALGGPTSNHFDGVTVSNCTIIGNGGGITGYEGIRIVSTNWNDSQAIVTNNMIYGNADGSADVEIRFWAHTGINQTPRGICSGNCCYNPGVANGYIQINHTDGIGTQVSVPTTTDYDGGVSMRGIHIGSDNGGADDDYNFKSGGNLLMAQNVAYIRSP